MNCRDHAVWELKPVCSFHQNTAKRNEDTHTLAEGNILGFQCAEGCDPGLKLRLPNQRAVSKADNVASTRANTDGTVVRFTTVESREVRVTICIKV